MLCKVCGAQIPDDAQECEFCGTKVNSVGYQLHSFLIS